MPRSMKNDNFIDKTFTVMADLILKLLPGVSSEQKKAFAYYRDGMAAQSEGEYAEALENYREALALEQGEEDRSYILYNMGLIYQSNGELDKALEYYHQALELNPRLCSALNNIAVLLHHKGELSLQAGDEETAEALFNEAAQYWIRAIRIAPNNYIEAQNWLKTTGRANLEVY
ncbi:photosystem I assembly protein Ycf3 [Synechococcus sp. JA-2-3B'a(2-13)]|uniref:Photosystem I assembly protein Ycf3 n=1 Tax=Synechococcus sp. (strain JA-2-3B'a(2-13)) TaxID=321332 RepID=YCF3_SYNJB|nr:photosystem I assembly protein Ycf3 [Synechococcus sp. JA-2-3B'a(2-13)]Q2JJK6.1 RecName: Full=Photosystem I assembly protein Ycf3 [Synechococcus sp. JA-2-3B'a(2-13)]ABD03161.1 photosystem I assembly protein Ycf3 [Synechococcus sp. JA-2-3B'a(2-13)]